MDVGSRAAAASQFVADPDLLFPPQLAQLPVPPGPMAVDAKGRLWIPLFTGVGSGDTFTIYDPTTGVASSHPLPDSPGTALFSAIAAVERAGIVLAYGYKVVLINEDSLQMTVFELPQPPANFGKLTLDPGTWITDMTVGDDGLVYVSRMNVSAITRVDLTNGGIRELPIPSEFGPVFELASFGGSLYLSNWYGALQIPPQTGRLAADGTFSRLSGSASAFVRLPRAIYAIGIDKTLSSLAGETVAAIPAANLSAHLSGARDYVSINPTGSAAWFAGRDVGTIVKLDVSSGATTIYDLPSYSDGASVRCPFDTDCRNLQATTRVNGLAVGGDGVAYFADGSGNRIGIIPKQ